MLSEQAGKFALDDNITCQVCSSTVTVDVEPALFPARYSLSAMTWVTAGYG